MGISDLYKIINEHCPEVLVKLKFSELSGISVAVDISIFLYKYVKTSGERWIDTFIILLCSLKKNGIKPVCIFDGPNPPIEKKKEQERRRMEAEKKKSRIANGKKLISMIQNNYIKYNKKLDETIITDIKLIIGARREKKQIINYGDPHDVLACLKEAVEKMELQNLPIIPEYGMKAKEIIDIMGFPYFQANGEAEALCSGMCYMGLVDAVLSEDTDVLAIGAPFLLSKIDLQDQSIIAISHEDILKSLKMNIEEFRDLCILLGCDYNDRCKGYPPDGKTKRKKAIGIGAKGAYHMINEYRTIEEAEPYIENPDILNYMRCRELLSPLTDLPNITIPYNKKIDEERLSVFLRENNVKINMEYVLKTWKPTVLKFNYTEVLEEDE